MFLVSFGGPEGPDDVVPFLENVTRGRGIPRERLVEVGAHYTHFGGVSPINEQNRLLQKELQRELDARGTGLKVYWGNRNWDPYLADAMRDMIADEVDRAIVVVTSAFPSYSGCRQYRENLADAAAVVAGEGLEAPELLKVRHYFDHPGFVEPMVDNTVAAVQSLDGSAPVRLVFTTHSVPTSIAETSGPQGNAYVDWQRAISDVIARRVAESCDIEPEWDLVYQSRSGPPQIPWLEPDISDHLADLKERGVRAVVMVPIGFVSDHMEVIWDLDTVAMADARELGLQCARAATVGADPRFVSALVDLVISKRNGEVDPRALTEFGPSHEACPRQCCPNLRDPDKPALCGAP